MVLAWDNSLSIIHLRVIVILSEWLKIWRENMTTRMIFQIQSKNWSINSSPNSDSRQDGTLRHDNGHVSLHISALKFDELLLLAINHLL